MPALIVTAGPEAGRRFELEAEAVIGRGKVDCVIADAELSRRHVAARPAAGGVEIEDLGSLNGTWFEGRRLDGPTVIPDGGAIRLGETELVVDLTGSAAGDARGAAAPPPPPAQAEPVVAQPPPVVESIVPPPPPPPLPPAVESIVPPPPPPPQPALAGVGAGSAVGGPGPSAPAPLRGGAFAAATGRRRGRRVATRMVVPALVTFLVIFATAIALIAYFATR